MRRALFCAAALALATGACRDSGGAGSGTVAQVDTVTRGVELFNPVAARQGADGSVYVLDQGNSSLYRFAAGGRVDTLAREGAGPAELKGPSVFELEGDSLAVVVDEGNGRILRLSLGSRTAQAVPYAKGARTGEFDLGGGLLFAAAFGQGFAVVNNKPVVTQDSLISVVSLRDGAVVREMGTPRPYPGDVTPIMGNQVQMARDARTGDLWLAWPFEPHVERYDRNGRRVATVERELLFEPAPPTERKTARSFLPVMDAQQVTYDVGVLPSGNLVVLAPVEAKKAPLGDPAYTIPPQALEVLRPDGALVCRVSLPVIATSLQVVDESTVLLLDGAETPAVYRVRFDCAG